MAGKRYDTIFWIETDKIKPNPMQPRTEFDELHLQDLASSIRRYGVLQPLVVTRVERETPSGVSVEYELISGERRLRASQIAGVLQVPVVIRDSEGEDDGRVKLELAIIENVQRQDLNAIERARAFKKLVDEFKLRHHEVATRVGKSREYVTNSLRLLNLPVEVQDAVMRGEITEGHCRPILMISERPEEQIKFYKDIAQGKMSVRAAEKLSRTMASERARPDSEIIDPEIRMLEQKLADSLGTRVEVERDGEKKRVKIDFFTDEDLQSFLNKINGIIQAEEEAVAEEEELLMNELDGDDEKEESEEGIII